MSSCSCINTHFISLYRALQNLELDEGFLWIPDLENKLDEGFLWIPVRIMLLLAKRLIGLNLQSLVILFLVICDYFLLFSTIPLILFISQSVSIKVLQPPQDPNKVLTEQEQFSQNLTKGLPFIISTFSTNVPAGLSIYWIVNNILTTIISSAVKNSLKDEALPAEVDRMIADIESRASSTGARKVSSSDGLSASRRAMLAVLKEKKKSFDPATIKEVQSLETMENEVVGNDNNINEIEENVAVAEDEAPKGPIGKMLKAGNDMAQKARNEEMSRFAEASASAMESSSANTVTNVMPSQRPNSEGVNEKNAKKKKN